MARLIDADALPRLTQIYEFNGKRMEQEVVLAKNIDTAPIVDAVPVVRCKDCKYNPIYEKEIFCECGARMDEEKEDEL